MVAGRLRSRFWTKVDPPARKVSHAGRDYAADRGRPLTTLRDARQLYSPRVRALRARAGSGSNRCLFRVAGAKRNARLRPTTTAIGGGGLLSFPRRDHSRHAHAVQDQNRTVSYTRGAHARPELSKTQSWKLLGTWCVGDHPSDKGAYVGIARDQCGENEETLIIGENGYRWEREEGLSCRYSSGKARFDNTIPASTKTVGVWVFHIVAGCIRRRAEGAIGKYMQSFDMYVSKGMLWIENLRSDEKP